MRSKMIIGNDYADEHDRTLKTADKKVDADR